ncbi:MAG: hypothetical protein GY774_33710 [Planctomycetes bacterium]|nr:hypothetical protein [Planctomycetota bacterium]
MLAYHGSANLFKEFDKEKIGLNFYESEDSGFFFTTGRNLADHFGEMMEANRGSGKIYVYEVELSFNDPVKDKANSEFFTPADKFDTNPDYYLRDAFIEKKDAIHIEGTENDDVIVVFEPHQVDILRVWENGVEIYNKKTPELTAYPEIMGPDVDPGINKNASSFHQGVDEDEMRMSCNFGNLLDTSANQALRQGDVFSYGDGRHFGIGEDFRSMAHSLITAADDETGQVLCRKDCLIAYDNDSGITMIHDLSGSDTPLSELVARPLDPATGFTKRFTPEEGHSQRDLLIVTGPADATENIKAMTPAYEIELNLVTFLPHKPSQQDVLRADVIDIPTTPEETMKRHAFRLR